MLPATPDRSADLVAVFGRRGEHPSWCWCQRFLHNDAKTPRLAADHRGALHREIATASAPPGLLAYVDELPAGWTRVVPRSTLPAAAGNRALAKLLEDGPRAWWATCFAVDQRYRRLGVGSALL